ncbi:hypothetical protein BDP27DRAFT_1338617 [Rhodocollybia butyracea]|uniref:Uncharacterized protein n=1 Tax=Rhodocollybia butyracea TaxID=206335 RepID=A0A9P5U119_9AGAR|nr:hypothetical protein BDP27DRAFT_1338617 [Rhodocollybia butyracea]
MSFLTSASLNAPAKLRPENLQIGSNVPTGPRALRVPIPTAPKALRRSSSLPSQNGSAVKRDSPRTPLSTKKKKKLEQKEMIMNDATRGRENGYRYRPNQSFLKRFSNSQDQKVKFEQACLELREHPFTRKENSSKKAWNEGDEQCSVDRKEITRTKNSKVEANDLSLFFPDAALPRKARPSNPAKIVLPEVEDTTEPTIALLTNEFWELQMKMNALEEKYREVMSSETLPEPDGCNSVQEQILEAEKRVRVEWVLEDVQRECSRPVIIPALLEAFRVSVKSAP